MPFVRQVSFLGGELSPWMHGRTDSPAHARGLKTCENFLVTHEGVAVSRPGTTMVRAVKDAARPPRLIPYVFSETEAYVVELGDNYARFHANGATVMDGGVPLEIGTPYTVEGVRELQWSQVGRQLILTHRGTWPAVLERSSGGVWTCNPLSFTPLPFYGQGCVGETPGSTTAPFLVDTAATPFLAPDTAHPALEWRWRVTNTVRQKSTGFLFESAPVEVGSYWDGATYLPLPTDRKVVLYPDAPVTLRRVADALPTYDADYEVLALNYYRGRGGLFGFVGTSTKTEWLDVGAAPDYSVQPPQGNYVFPAFTALPRAVCHFEDRRVFTGGSPYETRVFLSATGNFADFDRYPINFSGQPLEYGLAAQRYEEPLSLVAHRRLVVLTGSSVWSLGGGQGEPLDYNTVAARQEDAVGSSGLQPLVVDDSVLYVRAKGRGVRALVPTDYGGLRGVDLSSHAEHLFRPATGFPFTSFEPAWRITDWTYAAEPFRIVWAVRDDGALLSLTYARDGHAAWARHTLAGVTDGPAVSVCAIPEDDEDGVYLVVRRASGTFVERMNRRVVTDDPMTYGSVDCAAVKEWNSGDPLTLTGLSHLEGQDVYVVGKANTTQGPFRVSGGAITLSRAPAFNLVIARAILFVGLKFEATLELLPVVSTDVVAKQKTVASITFEVDAGKGVQVGQDVDHLTAPGRRAISDGYGAFGLHPEKLRAAISGTWDADAHGVLRQPEPSPVVVLGITREVQVGG